MTKNIYTNKCIKLTSVKKNYRLFCMLNILINLNNSFIAFAVIFVLLLKELQWTKRQCHVLKIIINFKYLGNIFTSCQNIFLKIVGKYNYIHFFKILFLACSKISSFFGIIFHQNQREIIMSSVCHGNSFYVDSISL